MGKKDALRDSVEEFFCPLGAVLALLAELVCCYEAWRFTPQFGLELSMKRVSPVNVVVVSDIFNDLGLLLAFAISTAKGHC